jgi:KUP system potassium uptake protein
MEHHHDSRGISKVTIAGLVITLGIVFGDIGTSPLYVMRAIMNGLGIDLATPDNIYGAISCVFWTLTLQTTVKYVLITLRADNKGEGGIFALYALIRKRRRWIFMLAIIGGSALLADGIITPAITVVSAVEGLQMVNNNIPVIPIVLIIISVIFISQQFGTNKLGASFGPIMFIWFLMLAVLGASQIVVYPAVLKSFSPYYAFHFLTAVPHGFMLLGAVFLCTTGAEALYSDLGHCGVKNIRISWLYVKVCLILNYLGQGAWILSNPDSLVKDVNPFFALMPDWFLYTGVIVATAAAIVASQALISGSFTIISEAIPLNFWPKVKIMHPTNIKGQMYIPLVNWVLYLGCIFVILFFQKSSNMEAAYGLAITITMLMTTWLMTFYLRLRHVPKFMVAGFISVYLLIEGSFLIANLHKFPNGGWFTILMAGMIFVVMYVWFRGRNIKKRYTQFVRISDYANILKDLKNDETVPKYATNLIYLTRADRSTDVESKIIYSIINKQPKRADLYWFVHVHIVDEPRVLEYSVETIIPDVLMRVEFRMGFKISPKINLFFKYVTEEMVFSNEMDFISRHPSLRKHMVVSDFRYIIIDRVPTYDFDFSPFDQFIMGLYNVVKRIGISDVKGFGLDTSNVMVEQVPLLTKNIPEFSMKRISPHKYPMRTDLGD